MIFGVPSIALRVPAPVQPMWAWSELLARTSSASWPLLPFLLGMRFCGVLPAQYVDLGQSHCWIPVGSGIFCRQFHVHVPFNLYGFSQFLDLNIFWLDGFPAWALFF